jgi:hypothetical protein
MVAVPSALPVTTPPLVTEAIEAVLLLQVPPGKLLDSVVVEPRQAIRVPDIADGVGVTVTGATELQPATV